MTNLSQSQIQHIAKLARLELTDEELKKYGGQLSDILNYIAQLKEVDTAGVSPTAQVTGLENVLRKDVVYDWNEKERDEALNQAPELDKKQVKVRRIFE